MGYLQLGGALVRVHREVLSLSDSLSLMMVLAFSRLDSPFRVWRLRDPNLTVASVFVRALDLASVMVVEVMATL